MQKGQRKLLHVVCVGVHGQLMLLATLRAVWTLVDLAAQAVSRCSHTFNHAALPKHCPDTASWHPGSKTIRRVAVMRAIRQRCAKFDNDGDAMIYVDHAVTDYQTISELLKKTSHSWRWPPGGEGARLPIMEIFEVRQEFEHFAEDPC